MTREKGVNTHAPAAQYVADLAGLLKSIPDESIVSRTVNKAPGVKVVLFGFAPGQALSDHSAGQRAMLHILSGEARLTFGEESVVAEAGAWLMMAPKLVHSVTALTEVKMLLILVDAPEAAAG